MSFDITVNIDFNQALDADRYKQGTGFRGLLWLLVALGATVFILALTVMDYPAKLVWGAYYVDVVFFMGLAAGSCIIPAILQIVRAKWAPPVWRLAEANVAFLPFAWALLLCTWFGKEHLFPWATTPMPGREWWMEPGFVYGRFAIFFFLLFFLMWRFVRKSLREDIGLLREKKGNAGKWAGPLYQGLTRKWKGYDNEVLPIQRSLSCSAPVLIFVYVITYTLFCTEMLQGMDVMWTSNLFGAFNFVGNVYIGWAVLAITTILVARRHAFLNKTVTTQQFWDLGKLTFGFCMLWGYMFFSQFLVQWYGNLPEETQWLIVRTRDYPWKSLGYITFAMAFILPFILLVSEDLKKTPKALMIACFIVLGGVYLEKYMVIMPQLSPTTMTLSGRDLMIQVPMFVGFLSAYLLSIGSFLRVFPIMNVAHPLLRGSREW